MNETKIKELIKKLDNLRQSKIIPLEKELADVRMELGNITNDLEVYSR